MKTYIIIGLLLPTIVLSGSLTPQIVQNNNQDYIPAILYYRKIEQKYSEYLATFCFVFPINQELFKSEIRRNREQNDALLFIRKKNKFYKNDLEDFIIKNQNHPFSASFKIINNYMQNCINQYENLNKKIPVLFAPNSFSWITHGYFPSQQKEDTFLYPVLLLEPKYITEKLKISDPETHEFINHTFLTEFLKISLGLSLDLTVCELFLKHYKLVDQEYVITWRKWKNVMQFMHIIITEIYPCLFSENIALNSLVFHIRNLASLVQTVPMTSQEDITVAISDMGIETLAHITHICEYFWNISNIEQHLIGYYGFSNQFIEKLFFQDKKLKKSRVSSYNVLKKVKNRCMITSKKQLNFLQNNLKLN